VTVTVVSDSRRISELPLRQLVVLVAGRDDDNIIMKDLFPNLKNHSTTCVYVKRHTRSFEYFADGHLHLILVIIHSSLNIISYYLFLFLHHGLRFFLFQGTSSSTSHPHSLTFEHSLITPNTYNIPCLSNTREGNRAVNSRRLAQV
jgi:hypothetical protein